ncbi:MMPL family transporter [Lactobacillus sp. ESL0791]|uniref:MMPL family transporter n=1 Tax=Lactobacillus sp. ESL0791 TaxID=2983234 RepID=UPI0023FA466D|nr:MMPL family transporter [Lactobacillus sp. ESL0791]MDF7638227.1 MMPL family transporter [Lactobacillus sp. ESL0791]
MQKFFKNHVLSMIAWLVIVVLALVFLPNVSQLTQQHANVSLPRNVQSEVAKTIQNDWPDKKNTYDVAVVFNKKTGKITADDGSVINDTVSYIKQHKSKYGIKEILAPNDNLATQKRLQSKDGTTWIMQLSVAKKHAPIDQVERELARVAKTDGIRTYVTGSDVLQNAFSNSVQEGIKKTEIITVIFIFIVLVIVFRSPIVPLISLLTVGVSFITSFSIVANLVERANFPFSNFTQVFMVIVLFGIGTDYNILLYDKFKENLGKGMDRYGAMKNALKVAGKTILFSGSSILIGFSALALAKFSIYQSAVGVAVGVATLLVVLLTLNPFFMVVLGEKMFWPVKKFTGETKDKLWHGLSKATLSHPIIYLLVLTVVVLPFTLMYSSHLNYDDTDEIADNVPAKAGLLVVQKHFSKGMAEPSYLYIKSKHRLDNEGDLKLIDQVTQKLQADKDVAMVSSVTQPYGEAISQFYVKNQLNTVNSGVDDARTGLNKLGKASKKLATGADKLSSGASELQSGTSRLQSGADQLQSGSQQVNSGLNTLNSQLAGQISGIQSLQSSSLTQVKQSYQKNLLKNVNKIPGLSARQKAAVLKAAGGALEQSMAQMTANNNLAVQLNQLQAAVGQLTTASGQLSSGLGQLNSSTGKLSSGAGKLATGTPKITTGLDDVNNGLGQGQTYLTGLADSAAADTFYIPKEYINSDVFKQALTAYVSPDKKSAMIIVVFKTNPSGDVATKKSQDLSLMAQKSLAGTKLAKASVAMGGQSSIIEDTKNTASRDFVRTAAIMLIGIGIALIFVTQSLLQPLYILGTLLIAYFCSLTINQWLVKALLGRHMLTWNTPFFSFIMLVALGVDYSIFLMTRYRELSDASASRRILKACGIIGVVVVSAAIILAGTFAALIPSGVPTLIEVAMAVIVGLLILVLIMPITLSAGVKLTYEGIHLPKRKKLTK